MVKKKIKVGISVIFILLLFLSLNVEAGTFNDNQTVDKNKNWTILFNQEVLFESAEEGIKVIDSKGKDVAISIDFGQNKKTIIVYAPAKGYMEGENYTLIIDSNVMSKTGKSLKEKIEFGFNIKDKEDNDEVIVITESKSIDEPVNKTIIIPEYVKDIILDFNGNQVKELIVKGDRNTIKNATLFKLNVGNTVDNLYLENINDVEISEHIFDGGGGNSITLQGSTTFKGKVKITSGTEIQIKSESKYAKIEGVVSVESSAKTIISAPVSNLVVNTENSQVVINAEIDKLVVRNDATITVNKGINAPIIEARIGTNVMAIDEDGAEVDAVVQYTLDTYELELNINKAQYRIENVLEGPYEGNVVEGEKEKLKIALAKAQLAIENKEATQENQENIDKATKELEYAIEEFDANKIKVDRWEINRLIYEVDLFLNHSDIVIGEEIGNYPQDSYDEMKLVFDEIREFLRSDKVTQAGVDQRLQQLQYTFKKFKSSKITSSDAERTAQFVIIGDNIMEWKVNTSNMMGKRKSNNYWDRLDNMGNEPIEMIDEIVF